MQVLVFNLLGRRRLAKGASHTMERVAVTNLARRGRLSLASWAFGRRSGTLPLWSTSDRGTQLSQLRRLLGWAAPAGAAFATLAGATGAAFGNRPTAFGATSPDELVRSADAAMYRDKQREAAPLQRQGGLPLAKGRRDERSRVT